jgi:4-amino-4-deoxychorismate lyase
MLPPLQLFTSLRYDPLLLTSDENSRTDLNFVAPSPFYMLAYHRDRMLEAAQHFDFDAVVATLADGEELHRQLLKRREAWASENDKQDGPLKASNLYLPSPNLTSQSYASSSTSRQT